VSLGGTTLVINDCDLKNFDNYIKLRKKKCRKIQTDIFFVTQHGEKMTTSVVARSISTLYKPLALAGNMGNMRKHVVSDMRNVRPQHDRKKLAGVMNHSEPTTDKYYAVQDKRKNAVEMTHEISLITGRGPIPHPATTAPAATTAATSAPEADNIIESDLHVVNITPSAKPVGVRFIPFLL